MHFNVNHQESYSRGLLLLRTILGTIYIAVPHTFLLLFVLIWSSVLGFIAFWAILFTGKYPQSWFEFQVDVLNWNNRVSASLMNLTDEYPAFGTKGTSEAVTLLVNYPESLSRGLLLVRLFFGWAYIWIPHVFVLYFRNLVGAFVGLFAWFVVLFTGNFPKGFFDFQVGTLRWTTRLSLYTSNMDDEYPPFSGK